MHQIRWLLGLVESLLRRFCHRVETRDLSLELRLGRSLLRRLGRTLRDQPRRESLN
jgi:cellulose synthase/poly-beta-1,6-N-acetylglucosamine synthase-like glycosyltransferase